MNMFGGPISSKGWSKTEDESPKTSTKIGTRAYVKFPSLELIFNDVLDVGDVESEA